QRFPDRLQQPPSRGDDDQLTREPDAIGPNLLSRRRETRERQRFGCAFTQEVARVGGEVRVAVDLPRRPADLDAIDGGSGTEAEVQAGVARRLKAAAPDALGPLPARAGCERDLRANAVAV